MVCIYERGEREAVNILTLSFCCRMKIVDDACQGSKNDRDFIQLRKIYIFVYKTKRVKNKKHFDIQQVTAKKDNDILLTKCPQDLGLSK